MRADKQTLGRLLARFVTRGRHIHHPESAWRADLLLEQLQTGDVLLVEGSSKVSAAIKYLTQSTWSHAALYVGQHPALARLNPAHRFVEADIADGIRSVGIDEFSGLQARICRPTGLSSEDRARVCEYAIDRIGHQYDLRNLIDLARFLLPTPPVPQRWRRRMLALGSGDPTRAICSTLIAQAFQSVRFPILPTVERIESRLPDCPGCVDEILHIRHHSLFVPRDFDLSPFFETIKPRIANNTNYQTIRWSDVEPP